jgi:hypothetical protein
MIRFWEKVVKPVCIKNNPKHIVEIGLFLSGRTTIKILEFCKITGGKVTVIDPEPKFNTDAFQSVFSEELVILKKNSLEALPEIQDTDLILIDGDHNWYTVYHELMAVEQTANQSGKFPTIIIHDIEWPYGRRDSYYLPELIPPGFQKPYARKGIHAQSNELVEAGGINEDQYNAMHENGEKNGVLTAVEDFLKVTSFSLSFHRIYSNNGLAILLPRDEQQDTVIRYIVDTSGL